MKTHSFAVAFLVGVMINGAAHAGNSVLLEKDGIQITENDILADAKRIPDQTRKLVLSKPENIAQMASNLLVHRTLAAQAAKLKLDQDPEVAAAVRVSTDKVLSEARLKEVNLSATLSEDALEAYAKNIYNTQAKKFERPEQVRARHILVKSGQGGRAQAESILKSLQSGADFAELAKEKSADLGSAPKGGDLGFFGRGQMVAEFDHAVFAMKTPGELAGPIETDFGFHIIKLEERRPSELRPFSEVREAIRLDAIATLNSQARSRVTDAIMKDVVLNKDAIDAFAKTAK